MNQIAKITKDIASMEANLANSKTSEKAKAFVRKSLDKAKAKLAELTKDVSAVVKPKIAKAKKEVAPKAVVNKYKKEVKDDIDGIKKDIADIEKAITNPKNSAGTKGVLAKSLEKAKAKLSELTKAKEDTPAVEPKKSGASKYKKAPHKEPKLKGKSVLEKYKGSGVNIPRDAARKARRFGKRVSASGKTYYEYRANRADVSVKRYPMLENGGTIPDNYNDKTAKQVWEEWTEKQRSHFISDHILQFKDKLDKSIPAYTLANYEYKDLPEVVKEWVAYHVMGGQYAKGGTVSAEYSLFPWEERLPNIIETVWGKSVRVTGTYEDALKKAEEMLDGNDKFVQITINKIGKDYRHTKKMATVSREEVIKYAAGGEVSDDQLHELLKAQNELSDEDFQNLTPERKEELKKQFFPLESEMEENEEPTHEELHDHLVEEQGWTPEEATEALSDPYRKEEIVQSYMADNEWYKDNEGDDLPAHFGSGHNIDVFGYETKHFDVCLAAVNEFERVIGLIELEEDGKAKSKMKETTKYAAMFVDNVFGVEKDAVSDGFVLKSVFNHVVVDLQMIGIHAYLTTKQLNTSFIDRHVYEIGIRIHPENIPVNADPLAAEITGGAQYEKGGDLTNSAFSRYRILYDFHHSRMGFQNSITVEALNEEQAIEEAKRQVGEVFGNNMVNRFTYKNDPTYKYSKKPAYAEGGKIYADNLDRITDKMSDDDAMSMANFMASADDSNFNDLGTHTFKSAKEAKEYLKKVFSRKGTKA